MALRYFNKHPIVQLHSNDVGTMGKVGDTTIDHIQLRLLEGSLYIVVDPDDQASKNAHTGTQSLVPNQKPKEDQCPEMKAWI